MNAACKKQVGSGHCNIAFMPGLANYPTDTLRENYMTRTTRGTELQVHVHAAREYDQPTSQGVALTYFQSKPNIQVFASFGDQMTAGAHHRVEAAGAHPGQGHPGHRLRRHQ